MRVLHLSTYGANSGAGIAALRLVRAERSYGIDARLLLMAPTAESEDYIDILSNNRSIYKRWQYALWCERAVVLLLNGFNREQTFKTSLGWLGVRIQTLSHYVEDVDLIHLHWTQHAFVSLRTLEHICKLHKPIVITLHDYWWAQGIEQMYPTEHLSPPLRYWDKLVLQRKKRLMSHYPILWVSVSRALSKEVSRSSIVPSRGIKVIGNVLNSTYYKVAKSQDQSSDLEPLCYQILFVATRLDDPIKGWDYLVSAMQQLAHCLGEQVKQIRLTLVGDIKDQKKLCQIPLPIQYLGHIADTDRLRELYHRSSIVISTSERESFGQTLLESLACGTPVIARDSGGPADLVIDGVNGTLVAHDHPGEMTSALYKHFAHITQYNKEDCRQSALRFAPSTIADQYAQLYQQLLLNNK